MFVCLRVKLQNCIYSFFVFLEIPISLNEEIYHLLVEHLGHMQLLGIRYYKFYKQSYSPEKLFQCLFHVLALAYLLTDTKVSMQLETSTIYY